MGQCLCRSHQGASPRRGRRTSSVSSAPSSHFADHSPARASTWHQRLHIRGRRRGSHYTSSDGIIPDIKSLIMETLEVIGTLVNNEQEPPMAMMKLNLIADQESGWLRIVECMIDIIPEENPLGPAVITLFLDESPLPLKETVQKLLLKLNLCRALSFSGTAKPRAWHRNVCIVLGCIAEKLAGPNSVSIFKQPTLDYLLANLEVEPASSVTLFSIIALEKYAQTIENKHLIAKQLAAYSPNQLQNLEKLVDSKDFTQHQVGFCAQWALDNLFVLKDRKCAYETIDTSGINVMLNHNDVSEYLKISPNGLEARCDVTSFESVRCTFQANAGVWFYEAYIITRGVMQIGWATKDSRFLNHDGYGIGDDGFSVAYDGCRRLLWHNAASSSISSHKSWKPGDVLGCLLDLDKREVNFFLNGQPLPAPHTEVFAHARNGFFAAASFMSFQQCAFNFGRHPFKFPPKCAYKEFNSNAVLTDEQRVILPKHKKLALLRETSIREDSCSICFDKRANVTLTPCGHSGLCMMCAMQIDVCPMCRSAIDERREAASDAELPAGGVPPAPTTGPLPSQVIIVKSSTTTHPPVVKDSSKEPPVARKSSGAGGKSRPSLRGEVIRLPSPPPQIVTDGGPSPPRRNSGTSASSHPQPMRQSLPPPPASKSSSNDGRSPTSESGVTSTSDSEIES